MEEKNYSDIEVLFGKSIITIDEIYDIMMETEKECSALGNEIWDKENPNISGMSLEHIKANPVTQKDRDTLNDLEQKLWHMCHQLIYDCIIEKGNEIEEEIYTYIVKTDNETIEFTTNSVEGTIWVKINNFTFGSIDKQGDEIEIDYYDCFDLFRLAQEIYLSIYN